MRLILNIIWLIFGGLWLALGYLLAALICFVLIITIPFGFAALRIASYALWPFGRTIVEKPGPRPGAWAQPDEGSARQDDSASLPPGRHP